MSARPSGRGRSSLSALLALAVCVGLGLLNLQLLTAEIDLSPIASVDGGADTPFSAPADLLRPPPAAEAAAYPATLARPLFRSSRRPPAAGEPPRQVRQTAPRRPATLPDDLQLIGIMKEGSKPGRALIRSSTSPTGEWMEVGHVLGGWRLSRIEQRAILFEAEGQRRTLALFPEGEEQAD